MATIAYSDLPGAQQTAVSTAVKSLLAQAGETAPATVDVEVGNDQITGVPTR